MNNWIDNDCCEAASDGTAVRLCKLHARAPQLLEVLLEVEWNGHDCVAQCPVCSTIKGGEHDHDCRLAAALEGLRPTDARALASGPTIAEVMESRGEGWALSDRRRSR